VGFVRVAGSECAGPRSRVGIARLRVGPASTRENAIRLSCFRSGDDGIKKEFPPPITNRLRTANTLLECS
jgi:hypothetical protein